MKVLFDYQIFVAQKFGGISRYFAELMNGVDKVEGMSSSLNVFGNINHYLSEKHIGAFNFVEKIKKYERKTHKIIKKNQLVTLNSLLDPSIDVFHPTYYDPYFIQVLNKPLVITIHDMIYENYPDIFSSDSPIAHHKRLHIEKADKIIAVSEKTKSDILKYYNLNEDKIEVVYHGIDLNQSLVSEDIRNLPQSYILYVGNRYGYKNFSLLIQAFSKLSIEFPELKLVLAGSSLAISEQELLYRNHITDKVIQVQATDEQLNLLYMKALFFVYPSLYEGFGLPILEAFKNGCPVLLSNASCFPEIAGDAAAYFEAGSLDSFVSEMKSLLESELLREDLVKKGKEKLLNYSIHSCIEKTIKIYKSLA
ncbi:glycosyltransferase family 4 protein [Sphingobacterium faecium]|uniref:glycosyltransferase family 4 protein n=1 Tax=Sphingobacterium faecium TaxID=34087 RepID=UPI003DA63126